MAWKRRHASRSPREFCTIPASTGNTFENSGTAEEQVSGIAEGQLYPRPRWRFDQVLGAVMRMCAR